MKKMKTSSKLNLIIAIGGIFAIVSVASPFFINPSNLESINWQRSQVTLSAIGFIAIFYAFYSTTIQLRKAMAKPQIKVAFNEKGEQQTTIVFKDSKLERGLPLFWIINNGNAVARDFQIDFIITKDIANTKKGIPPGHDNGNYVFPYYYEDKIPLWVNRPYQELNTASSSFFDIDHIYNSSKTSFEIKYKIYGDWKEMQEGILRVLIDKQEVF